MKNIVVTLKETSSFNHILIFTRSTLFCEKIATIVVAVPTFVVDQIATIVVDCDNCEHCDNCDHISPP